MKWHTKSPAYLVFYVLRIVKIISKNDNSRHLKKSFKTAVTFSLSPISIIGNMVTPIIFIISYQLQKKF